MPTILSLEHPFAWRIGRERGHLLKTNTTVKTQIRAVGEISTIIRRVGITLAQVLAWLILGMGLMAPGQSSGTGSFGPSTPRASLTPEQFGAIGNGVVDDTVAVQSAILAACTSNSILQLSHTYKITRTLNVSNMLTIQGVRNSYQAATLSGSTMEGTPILRLSGDFDGFTMRNVNILGPGRKVAGSIALKIDGGYADQGHIAIESCEFGNSEYGIYAGGIAGTKFDSVFCFNNTVGCLVTNASDGTPVGSGVVFINYITKGLPDTALRLVNCSAISIAGMECNATNRVLEIQNARVFASGLNLEHFYGTNLTSAAVWIEGSAASATIFSIYTRQHGRSVVLRNGGRLTYANAIWGCTDSPTLVAWDESSRAYFLDITAGKNEPTLAFDKYLLTNSIVNTTNFVSTVGGRVISAYGAGSGNVSDASINRNTTFTSPNGNSLTQNTSSGHQVSPDFARLDGSPRFSSPVTLASFLTLDQTTLNPVPNSTLYPHSSYVLLSPIHPITLDGSIAIASGWRVGDILILQGDSDKNTVTVPNNANTSLPAARTLGANDTLGLIWSGSSWVELFFSNNTLSPGQ